jgi:hypothetical protein
MTGRQLLSTGCYGISNIEYRRNRFHWDLEHGQMRVLRSAWMSSKQSINQFDYFLCLNRENRHYETEN